MALIKEINHKGILANYWIIIRSGWDKQRNTTSTILGLYVNKESRNEKLNNFLIVRTYQFEGELTREQQYLEIVKPIIRKDKDGNEVDINLLTDAESDENNKNLKLYE